MPRDVTLRFEGERSLDETDVQWLVNTHLPDHRIMGTGRAALETTGKIGFYLYPAGSTPSDLDDPEIRITLSTRDNTITLYAERPVLLRDIDFERGTIERELRERGGAKERPDLPKDGPDQVVITLDRPTTIDDLMAVKETFLPDAKFGRRDEKPERKGKAMTNSYSTSSGSVYLRTFLILDSLRVDCTDPTAIHPNAASIIVKSGDRDLIAYIKLKREGFLRELDSILEAVRSRSKPAITAATSSFARRRSQPPPWAGGRGRRRR